MAIEFKPARIADYVDVEAVDEVAKARGDGSGCKRADCGSKIVVERADMRVVTSAQRIGARPELVDRRVFDIRSGRASRMRMSGDIEVAEHLAELHQRFGLMTQFVVVKSLQSIGRRRNLGHRCGLGIHAETRARAFLFGDQFNGRKLQRRRPQVKIDQPPDLGVHNRRTLFPDDRQGSSRGRVRALRWADCGGGGESRVTDETPNSSPLVGGGAGSAGRPDAGWAMAFFFHGGTLHRCQTHG